MWWSLFFSLKEGSFTQSDGKDQSGEGLKILLWRMREEVGRGRGRDFTVQC